MWVEVYLVHTSTEEQHSLADRQVLAERDFDGDYKDVAYLLIQFRSHETFGIVLDLAVVLMAHH